MAKKSDNKLFSFSSNSIYLSIGILLSFMLCAVLVWQGKITFTAPVKNGEVIAPVNASPSAVNPPSVQNQNTITDQE